VRTKKYNTEKIGDMPTHHEQCISSRLHELLLYLYQTFPYYCEKYKFDKNVFAITKNGKYGNLWRICIYAEKWQNEISLVDIFGSS
jgi:hypothetical protein